MKGKNSMTRQTRFAKLLALLTLTCLCFSLCFCIHPASAEGKGPTAEPTPLPVTEYMKESLMLDSGPVRGEVREGISIFRGIPYAAPPVGNLRWKPPQPVKPWSEVRPCVAFGARAMQPKSLLGREYGLPMSEDCLYLNIWAPYPRGEMKLPVMLWIHGGGFTTGSGSDPVYDGMALARRGVVAVTLNYRLGPLGFFGHPLLSGESGQRVSGNYGLLDQIEALRWVQRNIHLFGGDPGCVTIFGESAGGSSVTALMASPLARGLFHRAIAESGFALGLPGLKKSREGMKAVEKEGIELARKLGCDREKDPLAALRAVDARKLLEASNAAVGLLGKGIKYRPAIDGWVLPDNPVKLFHQGRIARVPFMTGTNADEATIFLSRLPVKHVRGYNLAVKALFREHAAAVLALYPVKSDGDILPVMNALITDSVFISPARFAAKTTAAKDGRSYLYHFTRIPPSLKGRGLGAFHSLEIPYVFNSARPYMMKSPVDRKLSDAMGSYWINFARSGDPNGQGLPLWLPYDPSGDCHMEFGDVMAMKKALRKKNCDLFEKIMLEKQGR